MNNELMSFIEWKEHMVLNHSDPGIVIIYDDDLDCADCDGEGYHKYDNDSNECTYSNCMESDSCDYKYDCEEEDTQYLEGKICKNNICDTCGGDGAFEVEDLRDYDEDIKYIHVTKKSYEDQKKLDTELLK